MEGTGHGGRVVGNADKGKSLFLGGGNHFPQGAVSMNTGDGMGMDIKQICHRKTSNKIFIIINRAVVIGHRNSVPLIADLSEVVH